MCNDQFTLSKYRHLRPKTAEPGSIALNCVGSWGKVRPEFVPWESPGSYVATLTLINLADILISSLGKGQVVQGRREES